MAFLIEDGVLIGYPDEDEASSLVIPEIVTEIGSAVFGSCIELEAVKLPASLKKIGFDAFMYCENLRTIAIPEGVTEIGEGAFKSCLALEEVILPSTLVRIGSWCFSECESLKSITLPASLKEMGYRVFDDCPSLQKIEVAEGNTEFCSIDGVLYSKRGTELIRCPEGRTEPLVIPDGVEAVADNSLWGCAVSSVSIPDSVKRIGLCAFWGCRLDSITVPEGVTELGDSAFCGCDALRTVSLPQSLVSLGSGCFDYCSEFELIAPEGSAAAEYFSEG